MNDESSSEIEEEKIETLFRQDHVYMQVPDDEGNNSSLSCIGILRITKRRNVCNVEWHAVESDDSEQTDQDWAVIDATVGAKSENTSGSSKILGSPKSKRRFHPIVIEMRELGYIRVSGKNWEFLTLTQKDGSTHPVLRYGKGDVNNFLAALEIYVYLKQSSKDVGSFRVLDLIAKDLEKSVNELKIFGEHTSDFVSRFVSDPYTTTMGGFSKVTNFLFDYVVTTDQDNGDSSRSDLEMAEILHSSLSGVEVKHNAESGFEVITCVEDLGSRPEVTRTSPMNIEDWNSHFDKEGRIKNFEKLKDCIFHGGLLNSVRKEAWKFLLSYYESESTSKSRQDQFQLKEKDYFRMKLQWKSITPDQEKRFFLFHEKKSIVEKDVNRTDRTRSFYVGENNSNIQLLYDILMTYCMYDFDLGYVQGMSDLLSPILVIMEDEVEAFWCFVGFMNRVGHNFDMDQQHMKTQLYQLHILLQFSDPTLSDYFESHDSGNLYFCFRWLLILFKREFVFHDVMRLWEVLWTDKPCKNFHLLCCLAILDNNKTLLMENHFGFTEILKFINDLSQRIDLEATLCTAESIYLQLKSCQFTPNNVREIIGLPLIASKSSVESSPLSQLASSGDTSSIEVIPED